MKYVLPRVTHWNGRLCRGPFDWAASSNDVSFRSLNTLDASLAWLLVSAKRNNPFASTKWVRRTRPSARATPHSPRRSWDGAHRSFLDIMEDRSNPGLDPGPSKMLLPKLNRPGGPHKPKPETRRVGKACLNCRKRSTSSSYRWKTITDTLER